MELTRQSIKKSIDIQIDHAHIGIKACIENDQNGSGCVPGLWMSNVLSKKWGQCTIKSTKHITCITKQKLKQFEEKLDFWNLLENWNLRDYLKIGVLGIIWKSDF